MSEIEENDNDWEDGVDSENSEEANKYMREVCYTLNTINDHRKEIINRMNNFENCEEDFNELELTMKELKKNLKKYHKAIKQLK